MRLSQAGSLVLSASDLSSFVGCRHRTVLDLLVAHKELAAPPKYHDAHLDSLRDRGDEHERRYVATLRDQGLSVVDLREATDRPGATRRALEDGVDVVVQGQLADAGWQGLPDILRRVERVSNLGPWSYEVYDTKLARETRGSTILQLSVYSSLLADLQGCSPESFHVVTPDPLTPLHSFRVDDFAAYYRFAKNSLGQLVGPHLVGPALQAGRQPSDRTAWQSILDAHYPEPVDQCGYCRWSQRCEERRRDDDHLSFIAGAGRLHRTELESQGVATLAAAAAMPLPVPFKPTRGTRDTYGRIREQARVQYEQRKSGRPVWELLPKVDRSATDDGRAGSPSPADAPRVGLARMPAPSPGDIFLDLEAARFAREGGREYLFGVWANGTYRAWWATSDAEERAAFEAVMDLIAEAWQREPGMHVYHFGHYEVSAFKRLAGRYATRTEALDRLLRGERFVDLYTVTRQAIRAGVESYSIKQLEQYYGFTRDANLREVGAWLQAAELALEANVPGELTDDVKRNVEAYNADDCRSTQVLRDWLEGPVRDAAHARGDDLTRPEPPDGAATETLSERDQEVEALRARLLEGIDGDPSLPDHPQHARWLLAYLIDWHRREERVAWWEYLQVLDLDDEDELLEASRAIVRPEYVKQVEEVLHKRTGKPTGSVVNRYRYPTQELDLGKRSEITRRGETPFGTRFGTLVAHDRDSRTLDIKVKADTAHPDILFVKSIVPTKDLQTSVMMLAGQPDATTCGLDLLYRRPPRIHAPEGVAVGARVAAGLVRRSAAAPERSSDPAGSLVHTGETALDAAVRIVKQLDRSYLAIQGPPGAGKTYAGAHMIRALVKAGKKVGVTAVSHKVIGNLLEEVRKQAVAAGESIALARKGDEDDEPVHGITVITDNDEALGALAGDSADVLGGTAWLWSKPAAVDAVDVLFVDEAGQMSLANVLAVSRAAGSLVLLGDPQQLEQPQKGSHPDGVDVSALQHVIGGAQTMPPELGIFLPETYRLAPAVCRFTSEVFYEGKLEPRPGLEAQRLVGAAPFEGAGLWFVPVEHTGNQNASPEEVDAVAGIVERLLARGSNWMDKDGQASQLKANDLRLVSPYNAQVTRLSSRLADLGVPVGTVDKFQGQEAPVVIYSMATSRPEDAPRGMEFLYSLNRLNVATSRARCGVIIVASPALFEPECRTPRQMQLANALCRFKELVVGSQDA